METVALGRNATRMLTYADVCRRMPTYADVYILEQARVVETVALGRNATREQSTEQQMLDDISSPSHVTLGAHIFAY